MNVAPASAVRPGRGRLAAIILLGPLAGAFALVAPQLVLDRPAVYPEEFGGMTAFFVVFSYILGLVPAILAAVTYWAIYPRLHAWRWPALLPACLAIGAICGSVGVALTVSVLDRQLAIAPALIATGAWVGAAALALTALPFRSRQG